MPDHDWSKIVHERMQSPDSPHKVGEDVIAELAAHLEEAYEHAKSRGMSETAALEATLQEVTDWRVLAQDLTQSVEVDMNHRIKRLWLLLAVAWLGASLLVMVLQRPDRHQPYVILFYLPWSATLPLVCAAAAYLEQRANPTNDRIKRLWLSVTVTWLGATLSLNVADRLDHPNLILRRPIPVMFPLPWLAALVLVGAAGAYLAQLADVPRKTRLVVATSPALLLAILMLLLLPFRFADGYPWALTFFAIDAENLAVVPGLALLLGALPFLWHGSASSSPLPTGDVNASMRSIALPE
jgi:cytochrome bd-type quinol oxidase subunit 2